MEMEKLPCDIWHKKIMKKMAFEKTGMRRLPPATGGGVVTALLPFSGF